MKLFFVSWDADRKSVGSKWARIHDPVRAQRCGPPAWRIAGALELQVSRPHLKPTEESWENHGRWSPTIHFNKSPECWPSKLKSEKRCAKAQMHTSLWCVEGPKGKCERWPSLGAGVWGSAPAFPYCWNGFQQACIISKTTLKSYDSYTIKVTI